MLRPDSQAQVIPGDFRPLLVTEAGTQWFVRYYEEGGQLKRQFAMFADVQPILDHNGRQANHNNGWSVEGKDKLLRRAASVPFALIEKWKNEEGWDYMSPDPDMQKKARQMLNDSDYQKLRTAHWRV